MAVTAASLNAALNIPIVMDSQTGMPRFSEAFIRFLNELVNNRRLNLGIVQNVTIASGEITVPQNASNVAIATQGGASTDDLDTINGMGDGDLVVFKAVDDADTVVLKHNTGNILCVGGSDLSLDDTDDIAIGISDGTNIKMQLWSVA